MLNHEPSIQRLFMFFVPNYKIGSAPNIVIKNVIIMNFEPPHIDTLWMYILVIVHVSCRHTGKHV